MRAVAVEPTARRRIRPFGGRTALFVALLALAVGVATGGYEFLTSLTASRDEVTAGPVSAFPPQTVTYVAQGHFFLVRFDDDQFVALYERSPWNQRVLADNPDRQSCTVQWFYWKSEVERIVAFEDPAPIARAAPLKGGVFYELCSGWTFDEHGRHLFGGSTPLDRYPVHIINGAVVVNTSVRDSRWWTLSPAY